MGTDHERDFSGDGYLVRRSSEATSERSTRAACAAPLAGGRTGLRYVGNGTAVAGCGATRVRGALRIPDPPSSTGNTVAASQLAGRSGKAGISPRALLGRAQRTPRFTIDPRAPAEQDIEATSERSTRAACAAPLAGGRTGLRYVGNGATVARCGATRVRGALRIPRPPSSTGEHGCRPSACRQIW